MSWTASPLSWPASAASLRAQMQPVLAQVPGSNIAALARLDALASLAQLDSLAADNQTPIARLQALATRRQARLSELGQALDQLAALSGQLWHWQGEGDAASLASQLEDSNPPSYAHTHTVVTLLLSATPLTFWQELTL